MKLLRTYAILALFILLGFTVNAQNNEPEKLNLPGDNLNLFAVIKLFQDSETLEGFEKNLNAEDTKINNLDLNGDDKTDYIKVIDNVNGNDHTIVLQVAVNDKENQDVAVFTVQKDADNNVQIQLIGDETLYGKDYIIEPNYADNTPEGETPNPGYSGTTTVRGENIPVTRTTYVEVRTWPVVRYIYTPTYVVWHSPWYWNYYPSYWNPWRPYYWDYYYGYHSNWNHYYYGHYRPWHQHRYTHWNDNYYNNHRSYSNTVYQHRESGAYRNTYSRPETRQQGSADYLKRYPESRDRNNTRNNNQGVNRQDSRQGVNQPQERRNNNNSNVRTGTNRPVNSGNVNTRNNGKIENRNTSQPAVNTRSERPTKSTPAVKSERRQSEPRQENTRRSSEPPKSVRTPEKRSERNSESRPARNSEKSPNRR